MKKCIFPSFLIAMVIMTGCQTMQNKQTQPISDSTETITQTQASEKDYYFITCNLDGIKKDFSDSSHARYTVNIDTTIIVGSAGKDFINISYPGNKEGEFVNDFTDKSKTITSSPNLIYGIYGPKAVQTFESNYFEQGSVNIKVVKNDTSHVEGTFSGVVTEYTGKGFDSNNKLNLTDCSFSVKKFPDYKW